MLKKVLFALILIGFNNSLMAQSAKQEQPRLQINMAGDWGFQIDSLDVGLKEQWFKRTLSDHIKLPGSMTSNLKGDDIKINTPWTGSIFDSSWYHKPEYAKYRKPSNIKVPFWLQPVKYYKGVAWYQKEVIIPETWRDKEVKIFFERSHWFTTAWVDDRKIGQSNSLGTPDVFTIAQPLKPGRHRITVQVDNRTDAINIGQNSHSVTDHTQGNWNGLVGNLKLEALNATNIQDIAIYPDLDKKDVKVTFKLNSSTQKRSLSLKAIVFDNNHRQITSKNITITPDSTSQIVSFEVPMGNKPDLWDEFHPNLYKLQLGVYAKSIQLDDQSLEFGMRRFSTQNTHFTINGRVTFLRGTLDCAAFPLTGYPPTDTATWKRIFRKCKSYGLNHIRFHSWCPPEAAFEAADQVGMYLEIECSSWANQGATIGDGKPNDQFVYDESERIVKFYGNHPSFCMLLYGNEPAGAHHIAYLTNFVKYWKAKDPRRLYTTGAGWPLIPDGDFNSTPAPRIQHWEDGLKSIINAQPPNTSYDWRNVIAKWPQPTLSHEIGQWCVYPDFSEIKKYTGVMKAKNFEIFQDQLKDNGLGQFSKDFLYNSGKLQALCYKADIEAALRTPGFGGFQLLGLNDFPGQGTALVGVLNAFWQDKGYITGSAFSQFCNEVVPLARFKKMIFTNDESFDVPVEVAQFGPDVIHNPQIEWKIYDTKGKIYAKGIFKKGMIPNGNGISIGRINQSLAMLKTASQLTLEVRIDRYRNNWDFFVYPANTPEVSKSDVLVCQRFDDEALTRLKDGGKVLLTLKKGELKEEFGGKIPIGFSTIFWNTAWTHGQAPHTMGIFCNPSNPALQFFPTQQYSGWQWWDGMSHSNVFELDKIKPGLQPIVRVIDDWVTARSLGLVFECRVGKGKLIVSGIDLNSDENQRPEARQLKYSLLHYMATQQFAPQADIEINTLRSMLLN